METDKDHWTDDDVVTYIPFSQGTIEEDPLRCFPPILPLEDKGDVQKGPAERYALYKDVWEKFCIRASKTVQDLYRPIMEDLLQFNAEPGKGDSLRIMWAQKIRPLQELPVALVVGDDRKEFFRDMVDELDRDNSILSAVLAPSSFSSVQTVLKSLIEGFIHNEENKKRKPSMSLAPYDLQLLCSWFSWVSEDGLNRRLTVIVQDFESCNTGIFHDLLHLCRTYSDRLPFTFILGTASADSINSILSRAARSLISVTKFILPNEQQRLDSLIRSVFFDVDTFPSLLLSGKAVSWLFQSWQSYHCSFDALLTHIQLLYIQHFQSSQASLWNEGTFLTPDSNPSARTKHSIGPLPGVKGIDRKREPMQASAIDFRDSIRDAKYSFHVLCEVRDYLGSVSQGLVQGSESRPQFIKLVELFGDGKLGDICSQTLRPIRLLNQEQLSTLLTRIQKLPPSTHVGSVAELFLGNIEKWNSALMETQIKDASRKHPLSEDLAGFLEQLWAKISIWRTHELHAVWRTSDTAPPIEILNPPIRSGVVSALSRPGDYLLHDITRFIEQPNPSPKVGKSGPQSSKSRKMKGSSSNANTQEKAERSQAVIDPDICVLFSRYIEAGKTINVYDWYESFAQGLEISRERIPVKAGKGKKPNAVDEDEQWRRETFGRFMWTLHELDMLGMLRWFGRGSGKKGAECAGKVVWVIPE